MFGIKYKTPEIINFKNTLVVGDDYILINVIAILGDESKRALFIQLITQN